MPGDSTIEWTDASWNPVTGCTKVSAGCDHCYAERFAERWRGAPRHPYEQGFDLKRWPERLAVPLGWTKPRRVFVNSMSDLWHPGVPVEFIADIFAVMAVSPQHTYQALTKRPRRQQNTLNDDTFVQMVWDRIPSWRARSTSTRQDYSLPAWPLPNVWIGTSVEDQNVAYRIDFLTQTPAVVRFLSCEPLLGPLDLSRWLWEDAPCTNGLDNGCPDTRRDVLHWIIAGGESGPGFRVPQPQWMRSLRDQALDAHVAFFFKQWGGLTPKANGRTLDGRTWDEYPVGRAAIVGA